MNLSKIILKIVNLQKYTNKKRSRVRVKSRSQLLLQIIYHNQTIMSNLAYYLLLIICSLTKKKINNVLNQKEISKLTKENANTTPIIHKSASINKVNDGNNYFANY